MHASIILKCKLVMPICLFTATIYCQYFKMPTYILEQGSPKQPGGHECGYVVMRYMRDIISDKEMSFCTKV